MSSLVHLVRHGEVENPDHVVYADLPGFGLSPLGAVQADETAAYLAGRPIGAVCSSPLERAMQTAARIALPHRLEVESVEELTEWGLSKRWRGVRWHDLEQMFPGDLAAYVEHPWDMPSSPESLDALAARMSAAVERLAADHSGELVMVSHQDPLQAARLALTGTALEALWDGKPVHAEVLTMQRKDGWRLIGRWTPPSSSDLFPPVR